MRYIYFAQYAAVQILLSFRSANPCISCKVSNVHHCRFGLVNWSKLCQMEDPLRRSSRKVLGNRKNVFHAKSRIFRINVSSKGPPEKFWQTGKIYFFAMERNPGSVIGIALSNLCGERAKRNQGKHKNRNSLGDVRMIT